MAVHERTATHFPTFTRAAAAAHRDVTSRYVAVWCIAVTAFAVLHAAITVGASFWRYRADLAAHDATVAAIDRYNQIGAQTQNNWGDWPQIGPASLDLDVGAAVGQVLAATAACAILLAVALVLEAHGRRASAYVAALLPALSIATMAGVLARTAPMIPTTTDLSDYYLDQRAGLRDAYAAILTAQGTQDTATWWNWGIAAVVALLGVLAVRLAQPGGTYARTGIVPTPLVVDVLVVALVVGATAAVTGSPLGGDDGSRAGDQLRLLAVTLLVAVLAARAAAASRIGTAVALSIGFLIVHGLLYAAFDREGGASGGWGVGSGGPQQYASFATAIILVVTPVLGWIAGAVWTHVTTRRTEDPTPAAPLPA